ncbi:hypothetical protein RND71_017896 [Anisodus tanguticus]|uniref:DUF4408 domain-containing protein n=1 Tax=Anisodus tanguticus TaxID=243964 RepID=A0AAE1S374_9SOLA|nr:hypothetical protein RND71_017896 [Anisodus tanguticus]
MAALIKFGLTIELLLLSTGFISSFIMLKIATSPHYLFDMVLVNLSEFLNSLKSFLSSPFYICLFINSVVILILAFSKFHHQIKKFLNIFLDEKYDADDIQIQPQARHHEVKEDYMPNRTNSAIAMDTVMSFFSRNYNSHPPVLEDIQDEMPCSSVKDITIDTAQITTLLQSQTSWGRLWAKIDSAQTTATTTTLSHSHTTTLRAKSYSAQKSHNFPDISHLTEAREIISPRSPNLPHETTTRTNCTTNTTNYQENIEEEELEDDSLEATWKAIAKKKELKKSLTFNDALSVSRIGGMRGDISITTEESNKKFDDFIKKMKRERLLQRQESDQRAINNNMLNRAR